MELSTSMVAKLGDLNDRFEEVSAPLSDAETMADRDKFTALSKEFAEIEPVVLLSEVTNSTTTSRKVPHYWTTTTLTYAN